MGEGYVVAGAVGALTPQHAPTAPATTYPSPFRPAPHNSAISPARAQRPGAPRAPRTSSSSRASSSSETSQRALTAHRSPLAAHKRCALSGVARSQHLARELLLRLLHLRLEGHALEGLLEGVHLDVVAALHALELLGGQLEGRVVALQAAAAAATVAARLALGPVLLGEPRLHREADAARVGVHLDHAHLDLLALLEHVRDGADAALNELRDVHEAVDAVLELDECAVLLDAADGARDVH